MIVLLASVFETHLNMLFSVMQILEGSFKTKAICNEEVNNILYIIVEVDISED